MENNETKVTVEKEKKLTPTEQNTKDIKEIKDTLNQLLAALSAKVTAEAKTEEPVAEKKAENKQKEIMDNPDKYTIGSNEEITFVHLVQRARGLSTFINLPTLQLNLTMAGELVTVSRVEADQIVGKYRSWFDNGTLAVYNDEVSKRYAEIKKIKPASSYEISKYNLESIGSLNYNDLEDLVTKLAPAHKDNVIQYFKQKVYEASAMPDKKDPKFCDLRKLEILNRLSGCDSLKYEIEDLKKIK